MLCSDAGKRASGQGHPRKPNTQPYAVLMSSSLYCRESSSSGYQEVRRDTRKGFRGTSWAGQF